MRVAGVDFVATLVNARHAMAQLQQDKGLYRDALEKECHATAHWKHKAEELQAILAIQQGNYRDLEAELETLKAQAIGWAEQCKCVGGGA